jgi:hypothetical protein
MQGTGSAGTFQGVGTLLDAIGQWDDQITLQQDQVDFTEYQMTFDLAEDELGESLAKNPDSKTYLAEANKFLAGSDKLIPKGASGRVKRWATEYRAKKTPGIIANLGSRTLNNAARSNK